MNPCQSQLQECWKYGANVPSHLVHEGPFHVASHAKPQESRASINISVASEAISISSSWKNCSMTLIPRIPALPTFSA